MEIMDLQNIRELQNISISNLILIILNSKNSDMLRKCAEIELRKRIKNVGWNYDELLHFDDKVIKKRGLEIDQYLISPNVSMQQLMDTYFLYDYKTTWQTNGLLFSEKHLCNEVDFGEPFFSKVCAHEIKNLRNRANQTNLDTEKIILLSIKQILEKRSKNNRIEKIRVFFDEPEELFCFNEAMFQLDAGCGKSHEFLRNCTDEEYYKMICFKFGLLKMNLLDFFGDLFCEADLMQNVCGLSFVKKDSAKLTYQKKKLLRQVKSGFEVDYESEQIKKILS